MWKVIGPLYSILSLNLFVVAYLSATDRLKRNKLVGMRTKATMASDAAWYAAHRASAWSIAVAGVVVLGTGGWLLAVRPGDDEGTRAVFGSAIAVLVVVVIGGLQAQRAAKGVVS